MGWRTLYRELTAAWILLASYPLVGLAGRARPFAQGRGEPVILLHGLGGNRSNLFGLAAYVRMTGFGNLAYFEYSRMQSVTSSAEVLSDLVREVAGDRGVHLIGHSLGGTIARRFSAAASPGAVRSLITLASPYRYDQQSSSELAIFGEEDPVVPPPLGHRLRPGAVKRAVILPETGHLGVLYHAETLRIIESELSANAAAG